MFSPDGHLFQARTCSHPPTRPRQRRRRSREFLNLNPTPTSLLLTELSFAARTTGGIRDGGCPERHTRRRCPRPDCVVLGVEKSPSKLRDPRTMRKIQMVNDHGCVAFAEYGRHVSLSTGSSGSAVTATGDNASVEYMTRYIGGCSRSPAKRRSSAIWAVDAHHWLLPRGHAAALPYRSLRNIL